MLINTQNWTSSQFFNAPLRAFISLGGSPRPTSTLSRIGNNNSDDDFIHSVEFHYLVTLTDEEFKEIYQEVYLDLKEALAALNQKYGHWRLLALGQNPTSGDGCESCSAH